MTFSHSELVEIGKQWCLRPWYSLWFNEQGHPACSVVLTEITTAAREIPDVFAFYLNRSILIECKTSRSDFFADKEKVVRKNNRGIGQQRFYLVPRGLVQPKELPEGWGLIDVSDSGQTKVLKPSIIFEADAREEITVLLSLLRRFKFDSKQGVNIRCYTQNTKCEIRASATFNDTDCPCFKVVDNAVKTE